MLPQYADWTVEEPIPFPFAEKIVANLQGKEFSLPGFSNPARITALSVTDLGEVEGCSPPERLVKFAATVFCEDSFMEGALWPTVDAAHQAIWDEYERLLKLQTDLQFLRAIGELDPARRRVVEGLPAPSKEGER